MLFSTIHILTYKLKQLPCCFPRTFPHRFNNNQPLISPLTWAKFRESNTTFTIKTYKKKISYIFPKTMLFVLTSTLTYLHVHLEGFEGLSRFVQFARVAGPNYIRYRYYQIKTASEEEWNYLHSCVSPIALELTLKLQGFYIKSGQMCAANVGNAFPKIWRETMSVLQDQCPSRDFHIIRKIIEKDYGTKLENIFDSFEKEPIGCASIGQVHRASMNNKSYVVKVMYPNVEKIFRGDVRTQILFCRFAMPVHVSPLKEFERQFMTEFDYLREGKNLQIIRENLETGGFLGKNSKYRVPKPQLKYCTKHVLVMEELKGEKIVDALKKNVEKLAIHSGMSIEELTEKYSRKDFNNKNETLLQLYINILPYQTILFNALKFLYDYSLRYIIPSTTFKYQVKPSIPIVPINYAQLLGDLFYIHGHQILVNGFFNGDPHPGNILLLDNPKKQSLPKLGLIDYGQVKSLPHSHRILFCKLIIALANEDKRHVVKYMKQAGFKTKYMKDTTIYLFAKFFYDEDSKDLLQGKYIQNYLDELNQEDPIITVPQEFILAGRTSFILRGLAHELKEERSVSKIWKPIAEKVLKDEEKRIKKNYNMKKYF